MRFTQYECCCWYLFAACGYYHHKSNPCTYIKWLFFYGYRYYFHLGATIIHKHTPIHTGVDYSYLLLLVTALSTEKKTIENHAVNTRAIKWICLTEKKTSDEIKGTRQHNAHCVHGVKDVNVVIVCGCEFLFAIYKLFRLAF